MPLNVEILLRVRRYRRLRRGEHIMALRQPNEMVRQRAPTWLVDQVLPFIVLTNCNATSFCLEAHGFYRFDITQPHGLNSRCATTFVTRCLVGEPGITYKYLGLRMFSHPWIAKDAHAYQSFPEPTSTALAALPAVKVGSGKL